MTFNTLTFFVFTAMTFALYWLSSSRRTQNLILLAASYIFYGWWDPRFCALIAASSLVDYLVGLGLARSDEPRRRRILVTFSVLFNLGLLGVFKYYDFFAHSLVAAGAALGVEVKLDTLHLILPVGISFYTFQTLGYTIDVYRRRLHACRDPIDYFAYVSFFPQLVAGPIERGERLLPQFAQPRRFDPEAASDGLRQILWGMVQKIALADNLAAMVDGAYGRPSEGPVLAVATACFALQIYWDFAGYSNIAIGTARLFGVSLSQNFATPYFSRSVAEFWQRWHISLSTWFRDYVYIPLGGNRRGRPRQALNILLTFGLSGLWHGASWTFVVWGLFNGLLATPSIVRRKRRRRDTPASPERASLLPRPADALRMASTFILLCIGWVFFRAATLSDAWTILTKITTGWFEPTAYRSLAIHGEYLRAFVPAVVVVLWLEWIQRRHLHPLVLSRWPRAARWALYTALIWGALYVALEETSRFIYFQF